MKKKSICNGILEIKNKTKGMNIHFVFVFFVGLFVLFFL